jgi:hypothetical protein
MIEVLFIREANMQVSGGRPAKIREISETEVQAELRRAAHKVAWARMNGSIDAANPFLEPNANRGASEGDKRHNRVRARP